MRKGVPVSPGIAVARAYCASEILSQSSDLQGEAASPSEEVSRFENACAQAASELDAVIERVTRQVGLEAAAIFQAHRLMLRDPALIAKVKSTIFDQGVDASTALQKTLAEYTDLFATIQDDYLKERQADIRDVIHRIQIHLGHVTFHVDLEMAEPVVLVATEVSASQVITLDQLLVAGIITETGGATGHAAILARSLGIPAVTGLPGIVRDVKSGDLIAMDGREGYVHLNPGPEVEAAYRTLQREYVALQEHMDENRDQEPITIDGVRVELLANVNSATDAALASRAGASGVGLYRTEYLFLTHVGVPDEEAQLAAYRAVIESAPNRTVTIRTLDLGGDKRLSYLGNQVEANPALGWRSTRLLMDYPDFFQTQLRAIVRAEKYGKVNLLFPMISTVEEFREVKQMLAQTRVSLRQQGFSVSEDMPLGVMLEVPAAALCIDDLLDEVDFVSIGSNDLIQYLMAADRNNPKTAHLCEPFQPAVYRMLQPIIKACNDRKKPVTLCGEMAGRLRCVLPLLGMGLHRLSMSPAFVPSSKSLVRRVDQRLLQTVAGQVLRMKTAEEIRSYLTGEIQILWPDAILLDTND